MLAITTGVILSLLPALAVSQSSSTAFFPNPTKVPCPSNVSLVRSAGSGTNQTLSPGEQAYISSRAKEVLPDAWKAYIRNVNATTSEPLPDYVSNIVSSNGTLPKVGIAVSGGAYRAALFGAGVLSSLDGRNTTAAQKTGTGGLLQAATYIAALSGGSWLVTALAQADFPTIPDLIFPPPRQRSSGFGGILANFDLFTPGPSPNDTVEYIKALITETVSKNQTGLPVTFADIWSRILARHFVNGTTPQDILSVGLHGSGDLFSGIKNVSSFQAYEQPFPVVLADSIPPKPNTSATIPGESIDLMSEIWEFNPYETGSFDPTLSKFIPTEYLGSTDSSNCVVGFDQASYIMAVSSDIFNELNVSAAALQSSPIGPILQQIQSTFPSKGVRLDSAAVPNPFQGLNPKTYSNTNETFLALVDGGEDGSVLPFEALLVRSRQVDTIIAIDASDDTADNFSNGTDLLNAAKRSALFGTQYPFPTVPRTTDTIVKHQLNRRPTFFGCHDSTEKPLVIYIANGGPPANGEAPVTNTSTTQSSYSNQEVQAILDQAFLISTQGINGNDTQWGACLACAVVDRTRAKTRARRTGVCEACFERYCWKNGAGSVAQNMPAGGVALGLVAAVVGAWFAA